MSMASAIKKKNSITEVLPDGTVHEKISGSSVDKKTEEVIETFQYPPKLMQDNEIIEEIMPDGRKVRRNVTLNRVVQSFETRRGSIDLKNSLVTNEERYNIEEVVPGTVSAFESGPDSDYEEEMHIRRGRSMSFESDTQEIVDILPDGTKRLVKIRANRVVHQRHGQGKSLDAKSHVDEDSGQEIVPGTESAFDASQDSD